MSAMAVTPSRRPRRRFTGEFKQQAVRLVLDEGTSVTAVAREVDLVPSALEGWVKRVQADRSKGRSGRSKLAEGGVIVFNISNWHLSFEKVLARMAADAGLAALWQREPPEAGSLALGKFPSEWFIVARDPKDFGRLNADPRWTVPKVPASTPLWTDDSSNVLSVIRR